MAAISSSVNIPNIPGAQEDGNPCPICFEDLNPIAIEPQMLPVTLKCKHVFHQKCADGWAAVDKSSTAGATCPLCRRVYKEKPKADGFFQTLIVYMFAGCILR